MGAAWQLLKRTVFWSYERGTWQYDLAVAAILVFVLATPRQWFRDQPEVGLKAGPGLVTLVSSEGRKEIYRVDARVLAPPARTPELSNDLHKALQSSVNELRGQKFQILRIEATRDAQGVVIGYDVQIER
ncbi:MAG TPA: hypothetical protein VEH49_09180 [Methylomirabilota bacterium]|nr:hypothetical protein [Methylomirabilota bacterium]